MRSGRSEEEGSQCGAVPQQQQFRARPNIGGLLRIGDNENAETKNLATNIRCYQYQYHKRKETKIVEYFPQKNSVLKGSGGNPQGLHFVPVVANQAPLALSNPGAFGTFLAEKYIITCMSAKK